MISSKKIKDLIASLEARIVCGDPSGEEAVAYGFASDLMSDVLTLDDAEEVLLITGLANMQTIRTAEMADIKCIMFVRNKRATPEMKKLAEENEMILIECAFSMYKSVALLHEAGLPPVY